MTAVVDPPDEDFMTWLQRLVQQSPEAILEAMEEARAAEAGEAPSVALD